MYLFLNFMGFLDQVTKSLKEAGKKVVDEAKRIQELNQTKRRIPQFSTSALENVVTKAYCSKLKGPSSPLSFELSTHR